MSLGCRFKYVVITEAEVLVAILSGVYCGYRGIDVPPQMQFSLSLFHKVHPAILHD